LLAPDQAEAERLRTTPGVDRRTPEVVIAEFEVNSTPFPSDRHGAAPVSTL